MVPCPAITSRSSKGWHEREPALAHELGRARRRVVVAVAVQDDSRTEATRGHDLHERRGLGHHERGLDAEALRVIRDRLRVVARARRDDARALLRLRQRSSLLTAPRSLKLPVTCKLSSLRLTFAPSSRESRWLSRQGVKITLLPIFCRAASTSVRPKPGLMIRSWGDPTFGANGDGAGPGD